MISIVTFPDEAAKLHHRLEKDIQERFAVFKQMAEGKAEIEEPGQAQAPSLPAEETADKDAACVLTGTAEHFRSEGEDEACDEPAHCVGEVHPADIDVSKDRPDVEQGEQQSNDSDGGGDRPGDERLLGDEELVQEPVQRPDSAEDAAQYEVEAANLSF